jgi:hypothetical protein
VSKKIKENNTFKKEMLKATKLDAYINHGSQSNHEDRSM